MLVQRTIKARLAAARDLLADGALDATAQTRLNQIQAKAVIALLRSEDASQIDAETNAMLTDIVVSIKWAQEDRDLILAELAGTRFTSRRPSQDFTAFITYLTSNQWTALQTHDLDDTSKVSLLVDIVVRRLQCRNPSEATKKLMSSVVLAATANQDTVCFASTGRKESLKNCEGTLRLREA